MKIQPPASTRAGTRRIAPIMIAAALALVLARPAAAQYPGPARLDGSGAGSGGSSDSGRVSSSFSDGKRAFEAGDYDRAVMILSLAEKKSPKNLEVRMALQRAREKDSYMHSDRGRVYLNAVPPRYADALAEFQLAYSVFEGNTFARDNFERCVKLMEEQRSKTHLDENSLEAQKKKSALDIGVPVLKPRNTDPLSIDMEDKPQRQALEAISKATGISFIYDERLEQDIDRKRISLHIKNASFVDTMEILLTKTNTMYQIINDTTLLLAPNNPESERKYQDLVMKTFYLSNAQAKDVFQQVRSIIDVKKLSQNEQLNSITMRGTPDQIAMAQKIIDLNDKSKGEVVIDVEILEVNKTLSDNIGILAEPRSFSINALPRAGVTTPTLLDWSRRYNLKSKSQWHVSALPSVSVNFIHSDGDTKTLANPSVRVTEGEKADLHIGDRFPIFNCTTTGTVPGGTGTVGCTPTYTDIGIQIKLEPRVHHNQEVSLKLDLKITSLGATVSSGTTTGGQSAPAIGERSINTVIRMADGETEMLAGMLRDDDSKSYDGYPWIEKIPILRALFGNHSKSHHKTDVILLLTPHVIRFPNITEEDLQANWVGTEESPRLKTPTNSHRLNVVAASSPEEAGGEGGEDRQEPAAAPAGLFPGGMTAPADKGGKSTSPTAESDKQPPAKPDVPTGGVINLSLVPATLVVQAGKPSDIHVLAAGVTSLSKFGFTLRHGQLPLQCNSATPGELFTSGGGQPEMQFAPLPGGDCQITLTRGGGNTTMASGEIAAVSITVPLHGQDIINAINFEAYDGKGNPVPVTASPMQIKVE